MALQAIGRLKTEGPDMLVDYVVSDECRSLVEKSPIINRTFVLPRVALREKWNEDDCQQAMLILDNFIHDISQTHYDLSLNLFQEKFGGILQSFVQANQKQGLNLFENRVFRIESRYMEHLAAIPAQRDANGWHAVDIYFRTAKAALINQCKWTNLKTLKSSGAFFHPQCILPPLEMFMGNENLMTSEYLVFHPGSAWPGKRWPETHWANLAVACQLRGQLLVFTGAPEDRPVMNKILESMPPKAASAILDCVGKTSLLGAAWLISQAKQVVTGDTVAMHLAAALGTPTVSLFGPSNPVETGPYGSGHIIFQTDSSLPVKLQFEQEHLGLQNLRADQVAEYLFHAKLPDACLVWQTFWDQDMQMQVLYDVAGIAHPSQKVSVHLRKRLDDALLSLSQKDPFLKAPSLKAPSLKAKSEALEVSEGFNLTQSQKNLEFVLTKALEKPDAMNLSKLQTADLEFEIETRHDLIWEAYRIASNGIPLDDISKYLVERMSRFETALLESHSQLQRT